MPRKLGQHFLIRDSVLEQLATATCGEHTARVVEIGPGRGALTRHLLPKTDELHAVELDGRLAEFLREKFAAEAKLHVHQCDVLATDLAQWGAAAVAGNLPYYITSPIIERFVALDQQFRTAVFLVQWEVAERLLARPHSRSYGYLTVATQLSCDVQLVAKVPPGAFRPPPKVESAAVKLTRKAGERPTPELLRFVGRCFAQKRKTLRNNLRPFFGALADTLPEGRLRAEELPVAGFGELFRRLSATQAEGERSVH